MFIFIKLGREMYNFIVRHCGGGGVLLAVYAASSNVDEAIVRTNRLSNQTTRLRQLGEDIGHNILELQRLIGEARAQAASVSVTLIL